MDNPRLLRSWLSAITLGAVLVLAGGAESKTLFTDITDRALPAPFVHAGAKLDIFGPFVVGPNGGSKEAIFTWVGGVCIADFNGDGWNDIFVTNGKGGANALYINNGDADLNNGVPTFTEVAVEAGVDFPDDESTSCVAGDINNDGRIDLYITTVGIQWPDVDLPGLPVGSIMNVPSQNRLLLNMGNDERGIPHFKEEAVPTGAAGDPFARYQQPSLVDFDRSGALSIYAAAHYHFVLPLSASDRPQCGPGDNPALTPCYVFKRPPARSSILLKNHLKETGELKFTDATDLLRNAVDQNGNPALGRDGNPIFNSLFNFDPVWVDYNNDGWPDLLMADDLNSVGLFRNNKGKGFTYLTNQALTPPGLSRALTGAYMAMAPGDINGDGNIDFYVTNVGKASALPPFRSDLPFQPNEGTKFYQLFLNQGGPDPSKPVFKEVASQIATEEAFPDASLANPRIGDDTSGDFGWGAVMFDFDNDGRLDLLSLGNWFAVGLGFRNIPDGVVQFDPGLPEDPRTFPGHNNPGHLFHNVGTADDGTPILVDLSREADAAQNEVGIFNPFDSRGMAVGDLNNSGFLSVVVVNATGVATGGEVNFFNKVGTYKGSLKIFLNNGKNNGNTNKALVLRLRGKESNRFGIGARVTARIGDKTQVRELWSNQGHLGSGPPEVHIGVGSATKVDELVINWPGPNGIRQTLKNVPLDQQRTCFVVDEKDLRGPSAERDLHASLKECK